MADNLKLDRSLDEILGEQKRGNRNRRTGGGGNSGRSSSRRDRDRHDSYPRDGVRKSYPRDETRNLDSEWVHDRYEEDDGRRSSAPRRRRGPQNNTTSEAQGSKLRVENLHYELGEADLEELFGKIGPLVKVNLCYDRAGRSEGVAFVTYERRDDALEAIRDYDGANAYGQPIRLTLIPSRNPFDSAVMPSRPLADRITAPADRSGTASPARLLEEEAARKGIDRYVPHSGGRGSRGSRSRSPMPRQQRGGRRPGARREGARDQNGRGSGTGRSNRPRKTQEELDAEMEDYFGGGGQEQAPAQQAENGQVEHHDDIDMSIE